MVVQGIKSVFDVFTRLIDERCSKDQKQELNLLYSENINKAF